MAEKVYTKPKCLLPLSSGFCPGCLHSLATKLIAESIDELRLVGGFQERLMRVLAVNVDEPFSELAHLRNCHGRGVDPGARAAFGVNRTAQQHRVAFVKSCILKPAAGTRHNRKLCADFSAQSSFANNARIASGPENKFKRVDENRLACAGFACETGKSLFCFNVQRRDDDEIF